MNLSETKLGRAAAYTKAQRLLELAAISLFALASTWSLARLVGATGWYFPLVVFLLAPLAWLAADLLSGLLHWAFDSLGSIGTPIIGRALIRPFRLHHADPQEMTQHDFIETHGASCLAALPVLALTSLVPMHTWPLALAQALLLLIALGALATNQCHKWAHLDEHATPGMVRWAQRYRLVLPREHHDLHHGAPFDKNFCMSSGWCNPMLNALLRAWR